MRVRELTSRTRGIGVERMARELTLYLRGWIGNFGKCHAPKVLQSLEEWKHGTVRYRELRTRGANPRLAATTAGSAQGPWRLALSQSPALARPNAYFASLGILRLTAR